MQDSSSDRNAVEVLAEEFLQRYRDGERPPLGEYTVKYPELAEEIEDLFPALLMMENLKPAEDDALEAGPEPLDVEQLGDYRILREVGRGGMGIVYEAEQVSLGRHVALKLLPQNLLADAKQARRFEREAKAAAKLHHTNIVPVFGVGEHEGMHYYVMQFIQGLGLDEVLDELIRIRAEDPSSAPATGIGLPARRNDDVSAVEIARSLMTGGLHQTLIGNSDDGSDASGATTPEFEKNGAVSTGTATAKKQEDAARDTATSRLSDTLVSSGSISLPGQAESEVISKSKPQKLTCWQSVATMGVQVGSALQYAHDQGIQHRDVKPSNLLLDLRGTVWVTDFGLAKTDDQQNITHTGDILGTLRYMPPEAFEGQTDERGDVYSLGLTLYEMLAMQPAFDERDRNRLIKQVTQESPPRLDKLNPEIPRDLVTVIHKAIERDPAHRYQCGRELAEDLQRFIEDEPIKARRISVVERFNRWRRRNKGLAASLSSIACLVLVGFIGSAVAAGHFSRQEAAQRELANENGNLAGERAEALALSENQRRAADKRSYQALVGEARALRLARQPGYRNKAWSRLKQALAIDTPAKDIRNVRMEAAACQGDSMGTEPIVRNRTRDFALFPDSRLIAIAVSGDIVSIRTIDADREVARLKTALRIRRIEVAPDGKKLAILGHSEMAEIWHRDAENGWKRSRQSESLNSGRRILFFPDSRRFLISNPNKIWIYDTAGKKAPRSFDAQLSPGMSRRMSISTDGRLLASTNHRSSLEAISKVVVWNLEQGKRERFIQTPFTNVTGVCFTPDGRHLAVAGSSGFVFYDSKEFAQKWRIQGYVSYGLTFTSDARLMAFATVSRKIRLWRTDGMREVAVFDAPNSSFGSRLVLSPDGRRLIIGNSIERRTWRLKGLPEKRILAGHRRNVAKSTFSHNGKLLATTSKDKTAELWNVKTGKLIHTFDLEGYGKAVAFSPDDRLLAVGEFNSIRLTIWDVTTGRRLLVYRNRAPTYDLAFLPDGKTLLAAGPTTGLRVYDVTRTTVDGKLRVTLSDPDFVGWNPTYRISVSPSGERVAFSQKRSRRTPGNFYVWDAKNDQRYGRSPRGSNLMSLFHNISFLPDNRHVIFVANNGYPQVWEARGTMAFEIKDTRRFLSYINTLSPNGRWLAAAATAEAVTIIDVKNKRELFTLGKDHSPIKCIAWSPDGRKIAVGRVDGSVAIWDFTEVRRQLEAIGLGWK